MIEVATYAVCGSSIRDRCDCGPKRAFERIHGNLCGAILHLDAARLIANFVPIDKRADRLIRAALTRLLEATPTTDAPKNSNRGRKAK